MAGDRAHARRKLALAITAALLGSANSSLAVLRTWDHDAALGNWSTSSNWSGNVEPISIDPVTLPLISTLTNPDAFITLSANERCQSLLINDNYLLGSGSIIVDNGAIGVASGKLAIVGSVIQGTAGLTKALPGELEVIGANTFTGGVAITDGGILTIDGDSSLGNSANNVLIQNASTLKIDGTFSTSRTITPSSGGGAKIDIVSGRTFTLNSILPTNNNALAKLGAGTLVLNGASLRTGTTSVQGGILRLTNVGAIGTGTVSFSGGGILELANTACGAAMSLPASTDGFVRGTGTSDFTGQITVTNGVSAQLATGASSSDTLAISNYTGGTGSTTHITGAGKVRVTGVNTYAGAWEVDTGATLELLSQDGLGTSAAPVVVDSGATMISQVANHYLGNYDVDGTIIAKNVNAFGSSTVNIHSGGVLQIDALNLTTSVNLSDGGKIEGVGGASTFVNALTAPAAASNLQLAAQDSTDTLTTSSYTGGAGSTTHIVGDGEVILSNANTYSGGWAVDSGTLRLDNATSAGAGSSAIVVNSGGTLRLHGPTITRGITMNNGSTLEGSFNGTMGRPNGTISIASGAAVTFSTGDSLHTMLIGDSTNDLTGGGGGSTITIAPDSPVALLAASNYVGNWIVQSSVQPGNDNRFGDAGNTVTLDSGGLLCFSSFTTSRQFIIEGTSALQVFGGTMTFNSGLSGNFNTLQTSGDGVILNAAGSVTGNSVLVDGILKVNHNSALGSVPFQVFGGGGQLELGTGVTLSQNATMFNTAVLRGSNNTFYNGTITVDNVGGDDITLATVSSGDTFTIGNGSNDLTGGGAGSVITAAGPGRVRLTQASNVTADWLVTGGVLEINGENRLGTTNGVTVNGIAALQLTGATMTSTPLTVSNGALWATGTSSYSHSTGPKFGNAAPIAAITVLGASDVLTIDSAIRNVSAGASTTNINVNGPGRLVLSAGATSGADVFSGSWIQSAGILQVGATAGESINALGFKNGDSKQANSIRVDTFGTLAVGVFGSGVNTPFFLRANVTLNGGSIAATNGLSAFFGGDLILEASTTSRVVVYDPVNPTTETDVHLAAGAAGVDNNAAVTDWRFNSQLIVDPGTNNGGQFTIQRDGGTVSVDGSVCALIINEGAQVDLGGSADALSDGVDHVNVVNDGAFIVTQGNKNIGSLSGSNSGITLTLPGTSLTVHQHVSAPAGLVGNSGSFIKEGPGTLSVFSIGGGAITINDGAIVSSSGPAVNPGESITLSGGDLTLPSLYSNGQVTINSGSTLTTDLLTAGNDGSLVGGTDTGNILVDGGTVLAKRILLGSSAGGSGTLNVKNGGTVTSEGIASNLLVLNNTNDTTVTVTTPAIAGDPILDGSVVSGYVHDGHIGVNVGTLTTPKIKLGVTAGKTGSFTQNGGIVNVTTLGVGNDGTATGGAGVGTYVCNGAVPNVTNLIIGSSAGGVGEMTLGAGNPNKVLKTATLSIDSGAGNRLDLTDNKLIVTTGGVGSWNGSEYTGVTGLIQRGRGDGTWNGSGIVTSMEDATTGVLTSLAIGEAAELGYAGGTFGGVSVNSGDVLVMYTWGGDADLNGELNGDDYFYIDSNIINNGSVFGFHNGDFDYNGELNGDDYFIIDSNITFAQNSPPFPTGRGGGSLQAVPEPGSLMTLAVSACLLVRRRR